MYISETGNSQTATLKGEQQQYPVAAVVINSNYDEDYWNGLYKDSCSDCYFQLKFPVDHNEYLFVPCTEEYLFVPCTEEYIAS